MVTYQLRFVYPCVNTFIVKQNRGKNYLPHVYISHKVMHIKYNSSSLDQIPNFSLNLTEPTHYVMSHLNWYQLCMYCIFIHSFHWHVQNAMIPCRSQELLPFLSVMYFFLPPFSTNYTEYAVKNLTFLPLW